MTQSSPGGRGVLGSGEWGWGRGVEDASSQLTNGTNGTVTNASVTNATCVYMRGI